MMVMLSVWVMSNILKSDSDEVTVADNNNGKQAHRRGNVSYMLMT